MATYGDMQARIADELARTDLSQEIANEIQTAIVYYENERFWFNEGQWSFQTVNIQELYGLPLEFLADFDVAAQWNTWWYRLTPLTQEYLDAIDALKIVSSLPRAFALFQEQIRIWPPPYPNVQITINGVIRLPALINPTDTNAWMSSAEELVRTRALANLYMRYLRDTEQAEVLFQYIEQKLMPRMRSKNIGRRETGRLIPHRM